MRISLLNIEYNNELIITDVDDCLIKTTESILAHGLTKKDFWFNKDIYESNYISVFKESELTDWGIEFSDLIKSNQLTNYEIITSASNRNNYLCSKLFIDIKHIKEGYSSLEKIKYINSHKVKNIFVDDKHSIVILINNKHTKQIQYPKKKIINGFYRRFKQKHT